jgi:FkbM family methyltransferase
LPEVETFLTLLRAARQKEELTRPDDEVISAYIEAAAACPTRAEALHGAARYCGKKSLHQRAYEFATQGLAVPYPHNAPAIEDWIYEYGLLDELAVNAYWTGRYTECADACNRLLSEGKLPTKKRDRVSKNRQFAIDKMKESIALSSGAHSFAARSVTTYERILNRLGNSGHDITFVQVGAADGRTVDPLHNSIKKYQWKGLLIEPLPDLFASLRETYSGHTNLKFENSAVDDTEGTRVMYRVPLEAVRDGLVPNWAFGISSFYSDRNALGGKRVSAEAFARLKDRIVQEKVRCMTLPAMLDRHGIDKIDILQIDAEGHDLKVLAQIDFAKFHPKVINLEYVHLSAEEQRSVISILAQNGYQWEHSGLDLVAYDRLAKNKPVRVVFYVPHIWALGAIHEGICDRLRGLGWIADLKTWRQHYIIGEFRAEMEKYDYIVTLPSGGTRPLLNSYGIPREKIILVAHDEEDIIRLLKQESAAAFDRYAGYGVVSDTLACSSLALGITRVPQVVRLGVEFNTYRRIVSQKLSSVGYASSMSRANEYGVERKRGILAKESAELAGLRFSEVSDLPFEKVPDFYGTVDAVLMPSLQEGAGLPPLEAAAAGRLVIGTPVGHFPRLAYEGLGILAPLDANAFRHFSVEKLLFYKDNPSAYFEKCCSIQAAAKKRDWSYVIGDWMELISNAN